MRDEAFDLESLEAEWKRRLLARGDWAVQCPQEPSEKQAEFLRLQCFEALYGGAAGGGKSSAILMAALQYVHCNGYSAIIFRRTHRDLALPGAIMDRAKAWLIPQGIHWNEQDKRFTFPSRDGPGGASLTFGYLDSDSDKYRYQSAEFQFVGFDELTQFPESWYRYLLSRVRRTVGSSRVPLRVRCASNPGGVGHEWVYRRFVAGGDEDTAFVPALLGDNPHIDQDAYRKTLELQDTTTRAQLLEGKWIRDASGLVYRFNEGRNVLGRLAACETWHYLLGMDFGIRDATAYVVLAWRPNDATIYVVESWKSQGESPSEVAANVQRLIETKKYAFERIIGDVGGMGKAFQAEMVRRFAIPLEAADKVNKRGYQGLMNGALERGELLIVEETNRALIEELKTLPWSDEEHLHEAEGFENHCADALLYAWRACNAFHEKPLAPLPAVNSTAYADKMQEELERARLEHMAEVKRDDWRWMR